MGAARSDQDCPPHNGRCGHTFACQHLYTFLAGEPIRIEGELEGQGPVNPNEPRSSDRDRQDAREEPLGQPRIRVVERKAHCHSGILIHSLV